MPCAEALSEIWTKLPSSVLDTGKFQRNAWDDVMLRGKIEKGLLTRDLDHGELFSIS